MYLPLQVIKIPHLFSERTMYGIELPSLSLHTVVGKTPLPPPPPPPPVPLGGRIPIINFNQQIIKNIISSKNSNKRL